MAQERGQKIIDRMTAYELDTRSRVDTLIKSIFVLSGGALTISIGVFLRHEAPELHPEAVYLLEWSWYLLFVSLATSAFVLFIMIVQGYLVTALWNQSSKTGEDKLTNNRLLKSSRVINWAAGVTGFFSFLIGLLLLAFVSVSAIHT